MKKILSLLLILTLGLGLCACGEDHTNANVGNSSAESTSGTEGTQEIRNPADEAFLSQLYGTWDGRRWGEFAPVEIISFRQDRTCVADEQNGLWNAWADSENSIKLEVLQDDKVIIGGRLTRMQEGESVWYELRLWKEENDDPFAPAPSYTKVEQKQ